MFKVQIVMSTYNGEEYLARQVISIMNQRDVRTFLLIRDDGSTDHTILEIEKLQLQYKKRITYIKGENIGWRKSFMELLYHSGDFDFYGFSDQDDIWMEDKVITCIKLMLVHGGHEIKLAHCNALSVDKELRQRKEQEDRVSVPKSHKMAITTEYFQGCGMLWNKAAMKLIKKYRPCNDFIAHDYWVGLICYLFGSVYFTKDRKFYHIRYDKNSSNDGNVWKGRLTRMNRLVKRQIVYMNPSNDLLIGYADCLTQEDRMFLEKIQNYKCNIGSKIDLLIDKEFKRPSFSSTVLLKYAILVNRY